VTLDIARWPQWTPTVTAVEVLDPGPVRTGLRVRLTQPGNRPAVWTVTRVEEGRAFAWETRALGMRVEGIHRLEPVATGTRVTLAVEVTGVTAPILGWIVARVSRRFIPQEAAALKGECERA
ncbi:MAG: SRPBCC family protein, partial [Dehalococcoidia bacterium]